MAAAEPIPRATAALGMARSEGRHCVLRCTAGSGHEGPFGARGHRQKCLCHETCSAAEGGCGPQYSLIKMRSFCGRRNETQQCCVSTAQVLCRIRENRCYQCLW